REQNETQRQILDLQIKMFSYQQEKDDSLLRKLRYDVPVDKLMIVVADFSSDNDEYKRECFERLIGVTCAAVPSYYAVHEIGRDRTPAPKKFYAYIGEQSEEV